MQTAYASQRAKKQLLDQVVQSLIDRGFDRSDDESLFKFVELFWEQIALPDWQNKEPANIAGCCVDLWRLFSRDKAGPHVQVFNPNIDEFAWVNNGTVIFVRQQDMPFLVDSLRLAINSAQWQTHIIKSTLIKSRRNDAGELIEFCGFDANCDESWTSEALILIETNLVSDEDERKDLKNAVLVALEEVAHVVAAYKPALAKMDELVANVTHAPLVEAFYNVKEVQEFLGWLKDSHFTFLGYQQMSCDDPLGEFKAIESLGFFKTGQDFEIGSADRLKEFRQGSEIIAFTKAATKAHVHRDAYPDYILVKTFNSKGEVSGEVRILGLFTYAVHTQSPFNIPLVKKKASLLRQRSGLTPASHDGKNLIRVIETFPKDELFQAPIDVLFDTIMGVAWINERKVVRLFCRIDPFEKFFNCLIYVPREIYNTGVRNKFEALIGSVLDAKEFESTTHFSESILARVHIVFKLKPTSIIDIDLGILESAVKGLAKNWEDTFESAIFESHGEEKGLKLLRRYLGAFSKSYQERYDARSAIKDLQLVESLNGDRKIGMHLFHPHGLPEDRFRFKVMRAKQPLELSDVIPVLENLGLRVLGEFPFEIEPPNSDCIWLHDFELVYSLPATIEVATVAKLFESAFEAVLEGKTESDGFNRLVLGARLHWREVLVLRAYAAYMKQTAFNYSQDFIADTLVNQLELTRLLVALFKASFDPRVNDGQVKALERIERLREKILDKLEGVSNLNEDKILRRYFDLMCATLRTNYYQKLEGEDKAYLSFKFSPKAIADIPKPKPEFEIFVYSPRIEGVHLRGGKVARGGLRWSDRLQDYRTEVLGLVKAQQVKNAVIVPSGAKGGFVAKQISATASREEFFKEGIACYQTFIRGLLDITDNINSGEVTRPDQVICFDEPDPYLVVAADKGTATFSDIANEISLQYGHWLGDAFASGGSQGYDHKKMGITAKGAWVSVQRHFRELGVDVQKQDFSVIGIGDMAGDVFGNGMLLSEHICLKAAFNHLHIFIDPNPDSKASFKERKRLFELPKSSWEDYSSELISKGGGVFSRNAKFIDLSPEIQKAFGIHQHRLSPTELIHELLKSEVDLIWNGGIGTYVKSSRESHAEVGDKANDGLRLDGQDLRCKVFGEGGNLGMTQLGRIEFCLAGGACNTDFIDNAAGVDCSDHEVNIKILLEGILSNGDITQKQRNSLLGEMTEEVSSLVLANNYRQTQCLSLSAYQSQTRLGEYKRFMTYLEELGRLNPKLEFLPSDEEVAERKQHKQGLSRPELAVLLSYAKVQLKEEFSGVQLAEEEGFLPYLFSAFPEVLEQKFKEQLTQHPLRHDIVGTQVANDFVNTLGITAAHRIKVSTGADYAKLARAFVCAKAIFSFADFEGDLKALDHKMPEQLKAECLSSIIRRIRMGLRWLLRNPVFENPSVEDLGFFTSGIETVNLAYAEWMQDLPESHEANTWLARKQKYEDYPLQDKWVRQICLPGHLFSGLSVVAVARSEGIDVGQVSRVFFELYNQLGLGSLTGAVADMQIESHWQAMAREAFIDDIDLQLRTMAQAFFAMNLAEDNESGVSQWLQQQGEDYKRWSNFIDEISSFASVDFSIVSVASKSLSDLVRRYAYESSVVVGD